MVDMLRKWFWNDSIKSIKIIVILFRAVDQAGLERTEAWESAVPAEESPQPGPAKRKLWEILQEDIIVFIMGAGGEASLNLPCFLILAPHPSCHLAFPLLFVRAAGNEGDPV